MPTFHGSTHTGRVEESNEDSIGWDLNSQVWIVADGMGGHSRGEVASALVRDTILKEVGKHVPLKQAILDAHRAVVDAVQDDDRAMGSTVVAIQISNGACQVVWVGDSRVYLWRRKRLQRISRDHSFLELLLAKGQITEEQAMAHPKRNLVTQTLGMGDPVPDEESLKLRQHDWLLLCSDGLTDELTDEEIVDHLGRSADSREAVDLLIQAAIDSGGRDNISVLIVESDQDSSPDAIDRRKSVLMGAVGAIVLALILWWLI